MPPFSRFPAQMTRLLGRVSTGLRPAKLARFSLAASYPSAGHLFALLLLTALGLTVATLPLDSSAANLEGGASSGAPATLSISVQGSHLVDGSGNTVQLRGANVSGLENTAVQGWTTNPWGDAKLGNEPDWSKLVAWKMNAVRLPLNEASWLGYMCINADGSKRNPDPGGNYQATVKRSVANANAAGLYVILDLHWSAPGNYCPTGQTQMADKDNSLRFWTSIANTFKGNRAVLFELFNEPFGRNVYPIASSDWSVLRDGGTYPTFIHQNTQTGALETTNVSWEAAGMQAMLNAVRATGATNVVLAGEMGWDGDLSQWLSYKPTDPAGQLAAAWHAYPWGSDNSKPSWTGIGDQYAFAVAIAKQVPIVITETGHSLSLVQALFPWADGNPSISYLVWTWNPWGVWDLIKDSNATPSEFGKYYQGHLACAGNGAAGCR
jgi:endoglucanase